METLIVTLAYVAIGIALNDELGWRRLWDIPAAVHAGI